MIFDFWNEIDLHRVNRYFKLIFLVVIVCFALSGVLGG
jgi:hypothetical protein